MKDNKLSNQIKAHRRQLRRMTYDLLDVLKDKDLAKRLPFGESRTVQYQFRCMIGAQESFTPLLTQGVWKGFKSSLDTEKKVGVTVIRKHMKSADKKLYATLSNLDLLKIFKSGASPLQEYLILVEHESHHLGQLINFIFACNLPIPKSWERKWALRRE